VVALVTLDPARLLAEATKAGSPARTPEEAARSPEFKAYLDQQVEALNGRLARYETIKRVAVLPRELTPTLKLKRRAIHELHKAAIEALYA
jgi:long-chain acyl-CoA synthetase